MTFIPPSIFSVILILNSDYAVLGAVSSIVSSKVRLYVSYWPLWLSVDNI